jgi:UDP-glucose 4-epimerase
VQNILITGGAGFIGQHLIKRLSGTENKITVIDNKLTCNNYNKGSKNKFFSFYSEDIRNKDAISNIFKREKIDTCIHLAAKISVIDSITNPYETIDVNVNGSLNVLEACSKNGVKNFVFASSAAVYGETKKLPLHEEYILNPLSPYGTSKAIGETLVSLYGNSKKIRNTISLRFFNIYGESQSVEYAGVIMRFAERLHNGLPPIIYGDGKNTRDFISVSDAVNAIVLAAKADRMKSCIFNIGTGIPVSINDLAQKMVKISKFDLKPIYHKAKKGDIRHSYADITKSRSILKFNAIEKLDLFLNRHCRI